MPIHQIDIEQFISLASGNFIFDVRSPSEYAKAHIPGAISLPLFTDDQRKIIGTAYKQENRGTAVNHGLRFFSQRMLEIPSEAEKVFAQHNITSEEKKIFIHCWRGGMRSGSVAWLFNLYGYQVFTLIGGYKSFRRWVLEKFDRKYRLNILGGYTGSGKTEIIEKLKENGKNVINLEKLASHRGSAFGSLGELPQPSQEMFENCLAIELHNLITCDDATESQLNPYFKEIWIEDESRHIGKVGIPLNFWNLMRKSNLYFLEIPYEERLQYIVKNYGQHPKEDLINAILRIQKRLGGLDAANAIDFIKKGNTAESFSILLSYYDRLYKNSLDKREKLASILNIVQSDKVDVSVIDKLNAVTKQPGAEIENYMKRFIILLFLPLQFFGQDITGVWKGYLYSDTTKQFLTYEIAFTDNNNELSAFSYTVFVIDSVDNIGVKTLDVNVRDKQLELVDKKLIYDNYPEPPAKGVRTHISLHLSEKDDSLVLAGPWHTNRTKFFESIHGNIRVAKIKPFEENKIIPKLVELGYASSLSFLPPDYNLNASAVAAAPQKTTRPIAQKEKSDEKPLDPAKQVDVGVKEQHAVLIKSEETPAEQRSVAINSKEPRENTLPLAQETANEDIASNQLEKTAVPSQVIVKDANKEENIKRNKSDLTPEAVVTSKDSRKENPSNDDQGVSQKSQPPESMPESTSSVTAIKSTDVPAPENLLKKPAIVAEVPVIQAAAKITARKTETIRSVDIKQDSIILSLYDNGEIDGDTVSVVLNGKVIMPMQGLRATAINKTIHLTPDMPDSLVLVMYAENLGSIPPNTGLLVIRDGEDIIEIRFSGDYQKNSAIILRKRKR